MKKEFIEKQKKKLIAQRNEILESQAGRNEQLYKLNGSGESGDDVDIASDTIDRTLLNSLGEAAPPPATVRAAEQCHGPRTAPPPGLQHHHAPRPRPPRPGGSPARRHHRDEARKGCTEVEGEKRVIVGLV